MSAPLQDTFVPNLIKIAIAVLKLSKKNTLIITLLIHEINCSFFGLKLIGLNRTILMPEVCGRVLSSYLKDTLYKIR